MSRFDRAVQLAEIVGAVAVVVSLLYVGLQIRQNTRAIQDTSDQNSLTLAHSIDAYLFDDEFVTDYESGLKDYSTLAGS
jgi:hypothetical protein